MQAIAHYDQETVDRLCRAIAWAGGNEATATRLANMSVDESGMGSASLPAAPRCSHPARRLRQKSMGIIRGDPVKGIGNMRNLPACRLPDPGDEPLRHAVGMPYMRSSARRRGDLSRTRPAAHHDRDGARNARGDEETGRAGGNSPGSVTPQHPLAKELMASANLTIATAAPPWSRRRTARASRRTASAPATRPGDRRDREHRGSGAQHAHQQDQRPRLRLFGRRQLLVDAAFTTLSHAAPE